MDNNTTKNRICIYHFYDKGGIVDDYVIFALKEFKKICNKVVVSSNICLTEIERLKIKNLNIEIFERNNIGFDFGGWKDTIQKIIFESDLPNYDELILTNDSYYGPLKPWSEVLNKMDSKDCDFWGLTVGLPYHYNGQSIPEHIQSYFITIRKKMLYSESFKQYWLNIDYENSFMDCVANCEGKFTDHFSKLGYKWTIYCQTNESETGLKSASYIHNSNILCKYYGYPIIKKKTLIQSFDEMIEAEIGEEYYKTIDYIQKETDYNVNYILHNLLRQYGVDKLSESMSNTLILNGKNDLQTDKRSIVVASIESTENIEEYANYLNNIPENIQLQILSSKKNINTFIEKTIKRQFYIRIYDSKTSVITFLESIKENNEYDNYCFVHDTDVSPDNMPHVFDYSNNKSLRNIQWDNLLHDREFIGDIIKKMNDDFVGIIVPPTPYHDTYESDLQNVWADIVSKNKNILQNMHLSANTDSCPENYASMFWCKKESLNSILNDNNWNILKKSFRNETDFVNYISYTLPYYAQKDGYFTYKSMNIEYASIHIRNYEKKYQKSLSKQDSNNPGVVKFFSRHERVFKILSKFDKLLYRL